MTKTISLLILSFTLSISCFAQQSTVYFYRLKSLAFANTEPGIMVNDSLTFSIANGSYYKLETESDSIRIISNLHNQELQGLKLEKGKTYYIQVEVQGPNSAALILQTEFKGKPAIERLDVDKLAGKSENLETVKVIGVAPLPKAREDQAVVYLFRPFNVTGMTIVAQVSDGNKVYEMKNNTSIELIEEPGEIIFRTVNEGKNTSNTSLKLNLEKGKVYYIAVLRSGGALVLTETKEDYAKMEMKLE